MTIQDILKEAFVTEFKDMTLMQCLVVMLTAILCSAIICFVYSKTFHGALFSRSFCTSLFAMTMITTFLILAVRTNIYLTLGTLGALSIVRFRSAVKEPMDLAFMFLSICAGIVCGANLLGIAISGVLFISLILFVIGKLPKAGSLYIVVISCEAEKEEEILSVINSSVSSVKLKSKSIVGTGVELTYEVSLKNEDSSFVNTIAKEAGVFSATILKNNGEYV